MKLTLLLSMVAVIQLWATETYSQLTHITLKLDDITISDALNEIENQSEFFFLYSPKLIDVERKVNIDAKDETIKDILAVIFDKDVKFAVYDRQVILTPIEQSEVLSELQQQKQITGTVSDKNGPVPGANVIVTGTTSGTITDTNGNYTISVPQGAQSLTFTFIGMEPREVRIGTLTQIDVTLTESITGLDEVVVTALGISKEKREVVYSTQNVKSEEFIQAREINIGSALTGKIAGLESTQINAGPGSSSRVIIRGNNSLSNVGGGPNQQPLYVINGLPMNNMTFGAGQANMSSLNVDRGDGIGMINPDDIETISVLKGGAAAALYGSQAANGVILITTKSGVGSQGIGVEINSIANIGVASVFPNYQYEYGQGTGGIRPTTVAEAQASGRLSFGDKMDGQPYITVDGKMHPYSPAKVKENIKNFYNPRTDFTNTVAINANSQSSSLRFSVSDLRATGQTPNSTYKRKNTSLSVMSKLGKNDFIIVKSDVQYIIVNGENRPSNGYGQLNPSWAPYFLANTVDIRYLAPGYDEVTGKELQWQQSPGVPNPWYYVKKVGNSDETKRYITSASVQVNILPDLYVIGKMQRDFQNYDFMDFGPIGHNAAPKGYLNTRNGQSELTNFQASLNYNVELSPDFSITSFVGVNRERSLSKVNTVNGRDFVIPDFISLTNLSTITSTGSNLRSQSSQGTNSVFGSLDLGYKRFAYLSLTGRQDWFSVLNPGNNSIFYPSVGAGLILSDVINLPGYIDFLKLRANWAQVGSASVGVGTTLQTYTISTTNHYNLPTQGVSSTLQNPNLRPLMVTTAEGGFEIKFFQNRLGLDVTFYNKITTDDIVGLNISQASGFSGGNVNIGKTLNRGWEIMLTTTPIQSSSGFRWNTILNYAYNYSEIIELAPNVVELSLGTGIQGGRVVNRRGLPYATLMVNYPLFNEAGVPVYNSSSKMQMNVERAAGVTNPPHTIGFSNMVSYKNLSFSVLIDAKFGAVGFSNPDYYETRFGLTKRTLPGREEGLNFEGVDQNGNPFSYLWPAKTIYSYYNNFGNYYSAIFTHPTDFVKLRRMILNYNIPIQKLGIGIKSMSIAVVSNNLLTIYKAKILREIGMDPEIQESGSNAQGTGGVQEPKTRDMGINLMLKF